MLTEGRVKSLFNKSKIINELKFAANIYHKIMIVIDRNKSIQNIILTLTESTTIENSKYQLVLKCDATRNEYQILLPENISNSTLRYDLFQVPNEEFENLENGYFSYSVYQVNPENMETITTDSIEDGKLLIKGLIPLQPESYIIYNTEV